MPCEETAPEQAALGRRKQQRPPPSNRPAAAARPSSAIEKRRWLLGIASSFRSREISATARWLSLLITTKRIRGRPTASPLTAAPAGSLLFRRKEAVA